MLPKSGALTPVSGPVFPAIVKSVRIGITIRLRPETRTTILGREKCPAQIALYALDLVQLPLV